MKWLGCIDVGIIFRSRKLQFFIKDKSRFNLPEFVFLKIKADLVLWQICFNKYNKIDLICFNTVDVILIMQVVNMSNKTGGQHM